MTTTMTSGAVQVEVEEDERARRKNKKDKKREARARGPEEDQAVTILSHVGHRRPQTGHRIPGTQRRKEVVEKIVLQRRPSHILQNFLLRAAYSVHGDHLVVFDATCFDHRIRGMRGTLLRNALDRSLGRGRSTRLRVFSLTLPDGEHSMLQFEWYRYQGFRDFNAEALPFFSQIPLIVPVICRRKLRFLHRFIFLSLL